MGFLSEYNSARFWNLRRHISFCGIMIKTFVFGVFVFAPSHSAQGRFKLLFRRWCCFPDDMIRIHCLLLMAPIDFRDRDFKAFG